MKYFASLVIHVRGIPSHDPPCAPSNGILQLVPYIKKMSHAQTKRSLFVVAVLLFSKRFVVFIPPFV
uniref:Uncharacterized protein n=1 Tax=Nyssomyia neivai TaxID=330878 RepID=A0A1L8D7I4_9DIPT